MEQAAKNRGRLDQTRQVVAWLAAFLAFAFHLANLKAAADEVPEVHPAHNQLPPGFAGRQIGPEVGAHLLDRFGFNQRDVASVLVIEVTVAFEPSSRMRDCDGDRAWRAAMRVRKKYRFDSSHLPAHVFRAS